MLTLHVGQGSQWQVTSQIGSEIELSHASTRCEHWPPLKHSWSQRQKGSCWGQAPMLQAWISSYCSRIAAAAEETHLLAQTRSLPQLKMHTRISLQVWGGSRASNGSAPVSG